MTVIVFDIEADGLIEDATKIHCLCSNEIVNDREHVSVIEEITKHTILNVFEGADYIVGHNIIGYDLPMIKKFCGIDLIKLLGKDAIIDTYLWSKVANPDREMPKGCPTTIINPVTNKIKRIGPHGLEAWGWRVGERKVEINDWRTFTPKMVERCKVDVEINIRVYKKLCKEMSLKPEEPYAN